MSRPDGRSAHELRPIEIEIGYQKHAEGSCLIKTGETWVLCSASVEEGVPPFVREQGGGWVTASYAMLPRATHTRGRRDPGGRGKEIQRLVGRSLRAVVDMSRLGDHTIHIDCDVLAADAGTRVASITGGYVALVLALRSLEKRGALPSAQAVLRGSLAAVAVGIVGGQPRLDLTYEEDAGADVDMNVVMFGNGTLVEVQGTAEKAPFDRRALDTMLDLAEAGIRSLCAHQADALGR